MKTRAKIQGFMPDYKIRGNLLLTVSISSADAAQWCEDNQSYDLDIELTRHREKRSLDANALLWKCIGDIAKALTRDKWDIYLMMLKRYGKYSYVCIHPDAVEALKRQWRECEVIGEVEINGKKAVQMLCYYGSSTLNSKEFSQLLDGVISEMQEMGLETPPSQDMKRALEKLNETNNR